MTTKITKQFAAAALGLAVALTGLSGVANAATSEEASYTHPDCEGSSAVCGVVVLGNAGSYTLNWVALNAHNSQPSAATHKSCRGFDKKLSADVPAGNYDTFIVPASCSYKLKTDIKDGPSKDLNIFLTPGCQIIAKVSGTTTSNSWKTLEISSLSDAVDTDDDGKPLDSAGYKCGKLSGADKYVNS
nr:hypothetical protein [Hyphomonas sp. Mor2]